MKQMKNEYSEAAKEKMAAARQDERVVNYKAARPSPNQQSLFTVEAARLCTSA